MTHTLSPKDEVYVIEVPITEDYCYDFVQHVVNYDFPCDGPTEMFVPGESAYYKMEILDYYSSAGASGYMQFNWNDIDAP